MAKKDNKKTMSSNSVASQNGSLNKIAQKILSLVDPNYEYTTDLENKNLKFQQVMNREIDLANGVSHGSIIDFIQAQREGERKKTTNGNSSTSDFRGVSDNIFTDNIDQIYNYLVELYDNKYVEMMDLKYICKFIPVLGQAVKTTLDHLTASDSVADTVKRKIEFESNVDTEKQSTIIAKIEEIETDHKLLKHLKNGTFRNALVCGASYIYSIPYKELFSLYESQKKKKDERAGKISHYQMKATEGIEGFERLYTKPVELEYEDEAISIATESVSNIIRSMPDNTFEKVSRDKVISGTESEITDIIRSFSFEDGPILSAAMEEAGAYLSLGNTAEGFRRGSRKNNRAVVDTIHIPDGTKDPTELAEAEGLENLGNYIKYIEARDLVPFDIFGEVIGYYHIVNKKKKKISKNIGTTGNGLFSSSLDIAGQKKDQAVNAIVDSVSNMIVKNFNHKFLCEHQEFKKTIADCIIAKGIVDNEYSIQFIPAKYIYPFKVSEDIDGNGESVLAESLFPGKMLLSFLVAKLILFVNNTGDKTLVTTHKGPIDLYGKNQLDRAVRQLEGQNITFGDFLSPNVMFNKFNRNANILIPTSQTGTKLLEFEKLEGKSMDMGTEMEEKLEKMAIIGSSVPDTIMEYVNDINFSRQIVSSSIKYAGYISAIQTDFEEPLTDLYRDLLKNSNLSEECKAVLPQMKITLPRPKVISNTNSNENIRVGKEIAELIGELYYGTDTSPENMEAKRAFILETCKDIINFYDWAEADARKEKVDTKEHGPKKPDEAGGTGTETY